MTSIGRLFLIARILTTFYIEIKYAIIFLYNENELKEVKVCKRKHLQLMPFLLE